MLTLITVVKICNFILNNKNIEHSKLKINNSGFYLLVINIFTKTLLINSCLNEQRAN